MSLSESFSVLRPHIDEATTTALARLLTRAGATPRSSAFSEAVVSSAEGGKRFRALMAHVGWSLSSDRPLSEARLPHLAAALELYQASALVHDDIIDHADERRGAPTPHRRLADLHRGAGWIGSSGTFGRNAAILVGDFLFSAASAEADEQALDLPEANARAFARSFADMHAEVALGQYLDIMAEQSPLDPRRADALNAADSLDVALHKSAHYSVVRPAQLGAICGANSTHIIDDMTDTLDAILTPWGLAFQLRDDDLGVFGDPTVTGKPAGDDLREGKRTVLLALTWAPPPPPSAQLSRTYSGLRRLRPTKSRSRHRSSSATDAARTRLKLRTSSHKATAHLTRQPSATRHPPCCVNSVTSSPPGAPRHRGRGHQNAKVEAMRLTRW